MAKTRITDPLQTKGLRLKNRLVMAPMVTGLAADHGPSEPQIAWYRERASNGLGLVIVEAAAVAADALLLPFMLGIWDDQQISALGRLAEAIKAEGVPSVLQIVHAGARAWRNDVETERIGPSQVSLMPAPPPRPMTEAEIQGAIDAFASAAARAKSAGFDGVEIHAAHYYLLSQFLSPYSNRRTDQWGGSREARTKLVVEVTRAVRRAVGEDYPVFCRLNAVEFVNGGLEPGDAAYAARELVTAGVDVIDASAIGHTSLGEWQGRSYLATSSAPKMGTQPGRYVPFTAKLKAAVEVPVIAVGQLAAAGLARQVLETGQADLIALARQLITDPQAAQKLLDGRDAEIRACRQCLACFTSIRTGPVRCSVNREAYGGCSGSAGTGVKCVANSV